MTVNQIIKLGPLEAQGWQDVNDALVPIGERRATLAEIVRAAETLAAARALLKGTAGLA